MSEMRHPLAVERNHYKARVEEFERSFELYNKASMALMHDYKAAHPEIPENVWPDATAVNVWAVEEMALLRKGIATIIEHRNNVLTELTDTRRFWQAAKGEIETAKADGISIGRLSGDMLVQELHHKIAVLTEEVQAQRTHLGLCDCTSQGLEDCTFRLTAAELQANVDTLIDALENVHEYLEATLSPCEPDCTCVLHVVEAAFATVSRETPKDDESRCAVCGWPLRESVEHGCVRGNCSERPLPKRYYAPQRAQREMVAFREE